MPSLHSKAVSVMMRGDAHDCEDGMDMTDRSCVLPRQSSLKVAFDKRYAVGERQHSLGFLGTADQNFESLD